MAKRLAEQTFNRLANKLANATLVIHRKYPYIEALGEADKSENQARALQETIDIALPTFIKTNRSLLSDLNGKFDRSLITAIAGKAGQISCNQLSKETKQYIETTINMYAARTQIDHTCYNLENTNQADRFK